MTVGKWRPSGMILSMLLLVFTSCAPEGGETGQTEEDYSWLEEVRGQEAIGWAEAQNAETFARLKSDPRYESIVEQVKGMPSPLARLAPYQLLVGDAYQMLEDTEHPRGLWRRTAFGSLQGGNPEWETVLDVDALAEAEGVAWKLNALQPACLPPDYSRCMLGLSDGGSDAVVLREFDMRAREFVSGGFATTAPSRSWAAWVDSESLLIATDVGEGSLTAAMYPRVLKLWRRGQTLDEAATVMEADPGDLLGTWPMSFAMDGAVRSFVAVIKGMSEADFYYLDEGVNPVQLPVPAHFALPGLLGAVGGQLVFQTAQDWSDGNRAVAGGSLIGFDLAGWLDDPTADAIEVIFEPSDNRFLPAFFGVGVTSERVWFVVLDNIAGTLFSGIPGAGGWTVEQHQTPSLSTVGIKGADPTRDLALVSIEGFLTPPSTYAAQGGRMGEVMMTDEPLFDASRYVVEQKHASSADGTQIPYFLVRRSDLEFDGASPTLVYAYGGFGLAMLPSYVGAVGGGDVLVPWFNAGGTFVMANLRGGGEFGPTWHQAAILENRQTAYDDYYAVAEHLMETRVTSREHLGIKGESNGGLLVSVALTQRPDLYGAVLSGVPLTDMLNYHTMLAGASWMGEYGNPDDPQMRAVLQAYSPFQNVRSDTDYPEAFFYASTADDRVHPGHARKMVARLQAMGHPVLYYENTEGGHGATATPEQAAELTAMQAVYLMQKLGLGGQER